MDLYKFIDEEAPWEIASKLLLFSREITVEHVTEILGGKEDKHKKIYKHFLEKHNWNDNNLELCMRRVLQTFRLAGVESQVVNNVLKGFGTTFFQKDTSNRFVDDEESFEMAYLMIVMQTTLHNPNIKMKL